MARLGYDRYVAQGGDWGAQVATRIGAVDPCTARRLHLNMPLAAPPRTRSRSTTTSRPTSTRWAASARRSPATRSSSRRSRRRSAPRSTTPRPGCSRGSSRSSDGGATATATPSTVFTRDQLLTNVMVYWVTGTDHVVDAPLLGDAASSDEAGVRSTCPPASRATRRRSCSIPRAWVERAVPRHPLADAAARRPLRGDGATRRCSSTTCAPSSARCAEGLPLRVFVPDS